MTIKTTIDTSARTITFTPSTGDAYTFTLSAMHPDMREYAALHGMKQRLGDNAALPTKDGVKPTDAEKMAAIIELGTHYTSGASEWNVKKSGSPRAATDGLVLRAVAAIQGLSLEEMHARVQLLAEKKGVTERVLMNAIGKRPEVLAKMAELAPVDERAEGLVEELLAL